MHKMLFLLCLLKGLYASAVNRGAVDRIDSAEVIETQLKILIGEPGKPSRKPDDNSITE